MKTTLTAITLFITLISIGQSKKDQIEMLQDQQKINLERIQRQQEDIDRLSKELIDCKQGTENKDVEIHNLRGEIQELETEMRLHMFKIDSLNRELNNLKHRPTPSNFQSEEKPVEEISTEPKESAGAGTEIIIGTTTSKRKVVQHVVPTDYKAYSDALVVFNVLVNNQGAVTVVKVDFKTTTTSDQILLKQLMDEVKKQLKYNASPGAEPVYLEYRMNVSRNMYR